MLFCFNEVCWLTDSNDSFLLRSLQRALRERFQNSCKDVEDSLPNGNLFAVFLDTSLIIVNFSPATHLDDSQKIMDPKGYNGAPLLSIYAIRTKDVLCDKDVNKTQERRIKGSCGAAFPAWTTAMGKPRQSEHCSTCWKSNLGTRWVGCAEGRWGGGHKSHSTFVI